MTPEQTTRTVLPALLKTGAALALALSLAACSLGGEATYPERQADGSYGYGDNRESIFGPGGLQLFGSGRDDQSTGAATGVAVNAFLWRASLDTVSFMPLASADPFGGIIITDWHSPAAATDERFKVNVYILSRALRADGIKVSVFKQVRNAVTNEWLDTEVAPSVATEIENAILTRARQLRMAGSN